MRVAIIGGGLAGLVTASYLLEHPQVSVDIYDPQGIGKGASGVATGLLHPYPGKEGRRSWNASACMETAKKRIGLVEEKLGRKITDYSGILAEKPANFAKNIERYGDVEKIDETHFLITSGITLFVSLYLEGLSLLCFEKGLRTFQKEIKNTSELEEYDHVIVAAGHKSEHFLSRCPVFFQKLKGQRLTCKRKDSLKKLEKSSVGSGYMAITEQKDVYHVGATYERNFSSELPSQEEAIKILYPKIATMYEQINELEILDCRSGVRLARVGHYYPLVARIGEKDWAFTALGSRGVLYHAELGRILANAIIEKNENLLPIELSFKK